MRNQYIGGPPTNTSHGWTSVVGTGVWILRGVGDELDYGSVCGRPTLA